MVGQYGENPWPQPSHGQKLNRPPSKTEYFYRQPSNERAKISRQISFLIFINFVVFLRTVQRQIYVKFCYDENKNKKK